MRALKVTKNKITGQRIFGLEYMPELSTCIPQDINDHLEVLLLFYEVKQHVAQRIN